MYMTIERHFVEMFRDRKCKLGKNVHLFLLYFFILESSLFK